MFRTETKETTEIRFEDGFFDDMIKDIEKLVTTSPKGNFDSSWNAALKNCVYKLYAFFGRGTPPTDVLNLLTPLQPDSDKEEREMVVTAFFDKLVSDILKARIQCPTTDEHKSWNSAIRVCLIRLCNFFNKADEIAKVLKAFEQKAFEQDAATPTEIYPLIYDPEHYPEQSERQLEEQPKGQLEGQYGGIPHNPISHPSYYCSGGIETLDFIEAKRLNFTRGNALKYIVRAGHKDPAQEIQDLRKARFYIDWEINRLKGLKGKA